MSRVTKAQALQDFWSSFGLKAYPSTNVPDDAVFPWITYEAKTSSFGDYPVNSTVDIWYHTTSEKKPNDKAEEISRAIGLGGIQLKCDDGVIWLTKGSPFCTPLNDDNDSAIKRRMLNVTMEFLTI